MKRKVLLGWVLLLCVFSPLYGQFDVHFTHYWALSSFYNPAASGSADKLNIMGTYAMQLSGFENSPKSMFIGADAPLPFLKNAHSLGVGLLNETIGLFTNQNIYASYAYRLKLFGGKLSVGGQFGLLSETFNPSGIELGQDANDPAFPTSEADGNHVDLGLGVFYQHPWFYAGLSAKHITSPLIMLGETNEIQVDASFYFMCGGNIKLRNPLLSIQPNLQVMTDGTSLRTDITLRGTYLIKEKQFYGGITYSPSTSVTFLFGGEINSIRFGYAYELFTSGVGAANGSHDLFVGYTMDLDLFKKSKNKHKSIRVL